MKEAIKRGIKTTVVDRNDNFISLERGGKKEYVKQATKTSKDSYITVLIMENKVVTKKVLAENNIKVPNGKEFTNIEEAKLNIDDFIQKQINNKMFLIKIIIMVKQRLNSVLCSSQSY